MPRRLDAPVCVSEVLTGACAPVAGFTAATFRFVSDEPLVAVKAFAGAGFVTAGAEVFSSFPRLSDRAAVPVDAPLVSIASASATLAAPTWASTTRRALSTDRAGFGGAGGVCSDGSGGTGVVTATGGGGAG